MLDDAFSPGSSVLIMTNHEPDDAVLNMLIAEHFAEYSVTSHRGHNYVRYIRYHRTRTTIIIGLRNPE